MDVKAEDRSDLYQQYCQNEIEIAEKNRMNPNSVSISQSYITSIENEFLGWIKK